MPSRQPAGCRRYCDRSARIWFHSTLPCVGSLPALAAALFVVLISGIPHRPIAFFCAIAPIHRPGSAIVDIISSESNLSGIRKRRGKTVCCSFINKSNHS